jgi:CHAT domain-containing protein
LIVGSLASSQSAGLPPLPDVAAEADTVAAEFRSPHVLKGDSATLSAVKSELSAAAVFHFAGHSLFTPERAGLMLADDEGRTDSPLLLDAEVLRRIKLEHLQLAVLSACSTASGSGGSRGFSNVTEVLLRSGVPHVVASRWAVDSVATRPFLEDYYRNLLSGVPVSQVTRLTSRKILANPATSHPYYWSAFAAYGRP